MAGHRKDPLRPLQPHEKQVLERMTHCQAESAVHVERAKALLAVAQGASYPEAARAAGRKSAIAVSNLVSQFNQRGLQALELRHGGGNPVTYGAEKRKKIIDVFRTPPDREKDGTTVWSLTTLQQRLRKEGMKQVCTATLRIALHEAGFSWQRNRTWMDTGKTVRMRKSGPVEVEDPDGEAKKNLILQAYAIAPKLGLEIYNEDEAGPFQAVPQPGKSWQPVGKPECIPHEYVRGGTAKLMTLFHPSDGKVYVKGVPSCTNAVLHPWLKSQLRHALSKLPPLERKPSPIENRQAWERWQAGLKLPFSLSEDLPPLRMLLVLDNLTGHKTPELVIWLMEHGIMPLYTPIAGSWLNMAESIQNVLKTRALSGAEPQSEAELIQWLEQVAHAWNRHPTPFIWGGKRATRRNRARQRRHALSGSGAYTHSPVRRSRALGHPFRDPSSPSHLTH